MIEYTYTRELEARVARRALMEAGVVASLVAYEGARKVFVFDAYEESDMIDETPAGETPPEILAEMAAQLMARHGHTPKDFYAEAWGWLLDCGIVDEDLSVTDLSVLHMIHREYDGGLPAFAASF